MELFDAIRETVRPDNNTWSAYRYHDGELIWASLAFVGGTVLVKYGDARGYENGVPVYPSPEKYLNKHDWKPWHKLHPLPAKI